VNPEKELATGGTRRLQVQVRVGDSTGGSDQIIIEQAESLKITGLQCGESGRCGQNLGLAAAAGPMLVAAGNEGAADNSSRAAALANRKPCPANAAQLQQEATCCSSSIPSATMSRPSSHRQGDHRHGPARDRSPNEADWTSGRFSEYRSGTFWQVGQRGVARTESSRRGGPQRFRFWRRSSDIGVYMIVLSVSSITKLQARASRSPERRRHPLRDRRVASVVPDIHRYPQTVPPATQSRQPTRGDRPQPTPSGPV